MKHAILQSVVLSLAVVLSVLSLSAEIHAQQEVCTGKPSGRNVFSVGEVRTSILLPQTFQELNGPEWVLMDGRPLTVRTALYPHLSVESDQISAEDERKIPDARGRFLRMANNNVCADLRNDEKAHKECIARHDPDPKENRPLGHYQADSFGAHDHGEHSHLFPDTYAPPGERNAEDGDERLESGYLVNPQHETHRSRVERSGGDETRGSQKHRGQFLRQALQTAVLKTVKTVDRSASVGKVSS